ncbi:MAG: molybdopterin-guanine dinucleotide biosynthesis protein B [Candidatus Hodarchaeota archaeon]
MEQKKLPIICIIGPSGSGKTSTIEALVSSLPQYNIGTVKFIQQPKMHIDLEGKDSQRYRESGAKFSLCFAQGETVLIINKEKRSDLSDVSFFLDLEEKVLPKINLVLSEGPRDPPEKIPVILTGNSKDDLKFYSSKLIVNSIIAISGKIGSSISTWNNIPAYDINKKESLNKLVELIKKCVNLPSLTK